MTDANKRKRGRPAVPADQRRSKTVAFRATRAQIAKLAALGGTPWLRERIDRAKAPAAK